MNSNTKFDIITCPTCGAEYLPVEVYLPNEFFGKPTLVKRNNQHKIIDFIGQPPNNSENFICEYCNIPFKVNAKLQFNTKAEVRFDFDSDYTTSLKKQPLFLSED